ncbi:thioredoxin-like protein AAED1, chloroplastic [Wolffia australiana]
MASMAAALHVVASATRNSSLQREIRVSPVVNLDSRRSSLILSQISVVFPGKKNRADRILRPRAAVSGSQSNTNVLPTEDFFSLLEGVEIFDLDGRRIPITDLWKDRKVVVGFARHFGCIFCRKRADLLASQKEAMDTAGVSLALIGPGTVEQAKAFEQQTKFNGEVYADPGHLSFEALKLVSGASTVFTPAAGLKVIQLYMEGYRQDWELSFKKDTVARGGWQQGGILVAGPGNSVSYFHKDKEAGDDPNMEDVINACCSK